MPASAQDYKIGISAGLTGYAATVDRAWRDGVEMAAATLNAKGGVMGRKLVVVAEDNRSEPQEAVTVYRKMISSDNVNVFVSGCVSAGNFAAAGIVVRAQIPMVLCSILPQQPEHVKWAFSTIPPAALRGGEAARISQGEDADQEDRRPARSDPLCRSAEGRGRAAAPPSYGLELVGIEQYKQDDADLSVQISKMNAAGARAILKIGLGGTTLTAAKNIKQLGLDMLHAHQPRGSRGVPPGGGGARRQVLLRRLALASLRRPAGGRAQDGDRHVPRALESQVRRARSELGGRGWDGVMLTASGDRAGQVVRRPEGARPAGDHHRIPGHDRRLQHVSRTVHQGITVNPFLIAAIINGQVKVVQ